MWRLLWRSIDRFSLQHFKSVITELRHIKVFDEQNKDAVVDILQSIVEIVTYGDRQDPLIFECFMEYQVLAEFVRVLKISRSSTVEAPLLQYLSIMIQNMDSEHAIYYCLSNDYINNIVEHQYNFDAGDLALYYVSFLRAVSSKISRDTLCLLVKVNGDAVVSFPMYSKALKFAQHEEKMIQTAIRALTLNIYNICDDNVYQFVTTPPASIYFSDLVYNLRDQCLQLDALVHSTEEKCTRKKNKDIFLKTDEIIDNLYYFKDVVSVGESRLSRVVTQNLLSVLISPLLLPLLKLGEDKKMFDPLENELPATVYGVRSMLAVKYISEIQKKYPPESLGWSFCSELKRIIRCSDYVKATRRLEEFVQDKESIPYGCEGPCKVQSFDTLVDVPDTGSVTRISNVERGIGLTHRTGRRFCIKSVFFTGKVWMGDEVSKRAHTNIVMFWLVRDRRPEFAPLEFGKVFNMFDNEPVTATITADMRDRFQVLRRWSASVTGGTYAHREQIYVSRFFKGLNHRVTYNHQDQPIYENHTDNALFLYMAFQVALVKRQNSSEVVIESYLNLYYIVIPVEWFSVVVEYLEIKGILNVPNKNGILCLRSSDEFPGA
ncbi:hypothetical protein V6N11_051537 [Hibiscus sabdariffa]|uniref:Coat protein n=1 Tax=Hibiscus sabdariffa TaxID=183260 RepID=A0ABR2U7C8_9ROSI